MILAGAKNMNASTVHAIMTYTDSFCVFRDRELREASNKRKRSMKEGIDNPLMMNNGTNGFRLDEKTNTPANGSSGGSSGGSGRAHRSVTPQYSPLADKVSRTLCQKERGHYDSTSRNFQH